MESVSALLPLVGGAVGVPLTFWRLWVYVDKVRSAQLVDEIAARRAAEAKLAAAETAEDGARVARQTAQEQAAASTARIAGLDETVRHLTSEVNRLTAEVNRLTALDRPNGGRRS